MYHTLHWCELLPKYTNIVRLVCRAHVKKTSWLHANVKSCSELNGMMGRRVIGDNNYPCILYNFCVFSLFFIIIISVVFVCYYFFLILVNCGPVREIEIIDHARTTLMSIQCFRMYEKCFKLAFRTV